MNYLLLESVESTNSYVAVHADELQDMTMVMAQHQTAGRGQRGNSWEAEPGKNLTFTLFRRFDSFPARRQFAISEAVALAVADFLARHGVNASVKWPNDVYVDDRKICGILIENSLMGSNLHHSRIGVGININQTRFLSDAPNPVSLAQLTGRELPLAEASARIGACLEKRLLQAERAPEQLHEEFLSRLYRADGKPHPFRRRDSGLSFHGIIRDVRPDGFIEIEDTYSNSSSLFAFKEVEFLHI